MGSARVAAVADTGPLIHLAEIGCLHLLAIFEELHIPEGVWLEADRPATIREELTSSTIHVLAKDEIASFTACQNLERLQAGERESLLLCFKLGQARSTCAVDR